MRHHLEHVIRRQSDNNDLGFAGKSAVVADMERTMAELRELKSTHRKALSEQRKAAEKWEEEKRQSQRTAAAMAVRTTTAYHISFGKFVALKRAFR